LVFISYPWVEAKALHQTARLPAKVYAVWLTMAVETVLSTASDTRGSAAHGFGGLPPTEKAQENSAPNVQNVFRSPDHRISRSPDLFSIPIPSIKLE
jgi:hypothetical protein